MKRSQAHLRRRQKMFLHLLPNSEPGRPKNSKDTSPIRKERTFKPRQGASLSLWASEAQEKNKQNSKPDYVGILFQENTTFAVQRTNEEVEDVKTRILFNLEPFCTIDHDQVVAKVGLPTNNEIMTNYSVWLRQMALDLGRELNVDDQKQAKASYYAVIKGE